MDEKKKGALMLVAVGFGFSLVCFVVNGLGLFTHPQVVAGLGRGITFGWAMLTFGCIRLALAKGRHWAFGLLGFLNLVGVALLWFVVKDRPAS